MSTHANALLKTVDEYGFAALDLQLYIDLNPNNKEAIAKYNEMVKAYNQARLAYEDQHGPLRNFVEESNPNHFDWIANPWPWD